MPRRPLAVLFAVLLLAAAAAAPVSAARPTPATTDCSAPTLAGLSSVAVGDTYTITGCGFAPNAIVPVEVTEGGGCCLAFNVGTDSAGRFSLSRTAWLSGGYRLRAAEQRRNGRWATVAEWSFSAS